MSDSDSEAEYITQREGTQRDEVMLKGYIRNEYESDKIPSEVIQLLLLFYHIELFRFEYNVNKIKLNQNTITSKSNSSLHMITVGDWIFPEMKKIHTISMKIIRQRDFIGIGIVSVGYCINDALVYSKDGLCYFNDLLGDQRKLPPIDTFKGVLDCNNASLTFDVDMTDGRNSKAVMDIIQFKEAKYKWAVAIYKRDDCCTILEVN